MRSVSVIGIGETKFGKLDSYSLKDLVVEAGNKAIEDCGIDKNTIEALYMSNFNGSYWSTQSHIGPLASEALGLGNIPTLRTEGACASGTLAFRTAWMAVAAGIYDVVLVGGAEKMTHQTTPIITTGLASAADYENEVKVGATFPSLFAMMAQRYFYEYGNVREAMAMCAVQNHDNAYLNPDAQMKKKITVDMVKSGFPVADPLTVFDCSLVSDGAVFIVIAATDVAKQILKTKKRIIEVIGSGHAGDVISLSGKKSITTLGATVKAAEEAYKMANIKPTDVNFAEVHDCFTITQILNVEDLGFFEKGKGGNAVLEGLIARDGKLPINVSGGLKAKGHPIGATGLSMIYEVVTQMRGEAGERQLKNTDIGLTHNLGGSAGTCVINIFKGL
ncbi:putative acetyl-CoA acyltransferase [Clostridium homopropionicum DSM 5847]|uniref:Putative acetyl-CoA acyltransferase n=1 Tax=Clostridium homopropionicum DSM 5847 TaxID=1121318 RepID=A0A0L6Z5P2_9CLOT|nr:thiolase domain-containing protein [Clostridium homopropionicum]KOA18277.1 putative acetyl-CoA acyltransferase [Clostridium homopropionicum DSM 5847]SFF69965.1 acetyl-CoA C-acetyltransferase [Clostridium homopropionicum]